MRLKKKKSKNLPRKFWLVLASATMGILIVFYYKTTKYMVKKQNDLTNYRCWLKNALFTKKLTLFSHRSFIDAKASHQPSCREALLQLKKIDVNHLDIDLILSQDAIQKQKLIVAHPTEYKHELNNYSPCSNLEFDEFIAIVRDTYESENSANPINPTFFLSMEPKAAWDNTDVERNDAALTNFPSDILRELLNAILNNNLKGHCAVIVDIRFHHNVDHHAQTHHDQNEIDIQKNFLNDMKEYCEYFISNRLSSGIPTTLTEFDKVMPTIEFHPHHPNNPFHNKFISKEILDESIFWMIDTEEDLHMVSELHPYGIVSNVPLQIYRILNEPSFCTHVI